MTVLFPSKWTKIPGFTENHRLLAVSRGSLVDLVATLFAGSSTLCVGLLYSRRRTLTPSCHSLYRRRRTSVFGYLPFTSCTQLREMWDNFLVTHSLGYVLGGNTYQKIQCVLFASLNFTSSCSQTVSDHANTPCKQCHNPRHKFHNPAPDPPANQSSPLSSRLS